MSIVVGSVGQHVEMVQDALNSLRGQQNLVVDGIFGKNTVTAVARFQISSGLPGHGVVDESTATALGLDALVTAGHAFQLDLDTIVAALFGEVHLPLVARDHAGMDARRQRLRVLFTSVPADQSQALRQRLEDAGDELGAAFQGELHAATIAELLGLLPTGGDEPASGVVLELSVAGSSAPAGHYFTWAPVPCSLRVADPAGAAGPIAVLIRNGSTAAGGQLAFRAADTGAGVDELELELDPNGTPSSFQIVPAFGSPSVEDGDAGLAVVVAGDADPTLRASAMVRIRKNANTLTAGERDRFLAAFAILNDNGAGVFQDFRDMHVSMSDPEAHGRAAFLPWHRAFLLDLERELQAIDPSVTIPYWRFDQPAPAVFSPDFMGRSTPGSQPDIAPTNPLTTWATDGQPGIQRRARFVEQTEAAQGLPGFPLRNQVDTLGLGSTYTSFRAMEGSPHGAAHVSFDGNINAIHTAAKDPLFFMLHCNVDRLWALWQFLNQRYDQSDSAVYPSVGMSGTDRIGHRLLDTMWPWNDDRNAPRPPTAPRTPLAASQVTQAPGAAPTVGDVIDYQGQVAAGNWLAFGYDDVPFEL
jgi:tyrosinase